MRNKALLSIIGIAAFIVVSCTPGQGPQLGGPASGTFSYDPKTGNFTIQGNAPLQGVVTPPAGGYLAPTTAPAASTPVPTTGARPANPSPPAAPSPAAGKTVRVSQSNDWTRVVLYEDGTLRTDLNTSENQEVHPAYETRFTVPNTFKARMLVYEGVQGLLLQDGQVLVRKNNGVKVQIEPGKTYVYQGEEGLNNGFELKPDEGYGSTPDKVRIISEDPNVWYHVVETPSKRIYQDHDIGPANTGFTVKFTVPADDPKIDRFWQGVNAVLYDDAGNRIVGGEHDTNKVVRLEPGKTYMVVGGNLNGSFALETSPNPTK